MRRFIVAWSDHGCLTALAWVKWLKAKVIHQAQDGTADESRRAVAPLQCQECKMQRVGQQARPYPNEA